MKNSVQNLTPGGKYDFIPIDTQILFSILTADTKDLYEFLVNYLGSVGYKTIHADGDNYIVGIPNLEENYSPISLVAHIDTVRKDKDCCLMQTKNIVKNTFGILGADDRAGVYAIYEIVKRSSLKPIVIFANYEEVGGIGTKKLVQTELLKDYYDHIDLFVELDRRGTKDYVYYSDSLPESLHELAKWYGFEKASGSYSDVATLTEDSGIPHYNLSVGYQNEHRSEEFLDVVALERTMNAVKEMIEDNQAPRESIVKKVYTNSPMQNFYSKGIDKKTSSKNRFSATSFKGKKYWDQRAKDVVEFLHPYDGYE